MLDRLFVAVAAILALGLSSCAPFDGEVFLDAYGGFNFADDIDVEGVAIADDDLDNSATAGGRIGYFANTGSPLQLGAAFDGSVILLEDDASEQFDLVYLTPMVLLRYGFFPNEYAPNGIVQPYGGFGPSLVIADYEPIDDEAVTVGVDARAGVAFHIPTDLPVDAGLFVEYRYTYAEPEFDLDDPLGPDDIDVETSIRTRRANRSMTRSSTSTPRPGSSRGATRPSVPRRRGFATSVRASSDPRAGYSRSSNAFAVAKTWSAAARLR